MPWKTDFYIWKGKFTQIKHFFSPAYKSNHTWSREAKLRPSGESRKRRSQPPSSHHSAVILSVTIFVFPLACRRPPPRFPFSLLHTHCLCWLLRTDGGPRLASSRGLPWWFWTGSQVSSATSTFCLEDRDCASGAVPECGDGRLGLKERLGRQDSRAETPGPPFLQVTCPPRAAVSSREKGDHVSARSLESLRTFQQEHGANCSARSAALVAAQSSLAIPNTSSRSAFLRPAGTS